jgi:predicted regulator of Ras-like GTPase activity (Roadblock/LC7/MglB family)
VTELDELLGAMGRQLEKAWVLGIADNDGMLIASWQSPDNQMSPEFFAGHAIRLIRSLGSLFTDAGQEMVSGFGGIFSGLEDVVLTTGFSYLMFRPMSKGSCFLLIDAPRDVPLGMLRLTVNAYVPKLEKCLPGA